MSRLSNYRRFGIRSVQGWLEPDVLDVLEILLIGEPEKGGIAEIGVHHGKLFIGLQLLSPGGPAVAMDLFDDQDMNIDRSGEGDRARFVRNVQRWGDPSTLVIHQGDSTELSEDDLRGYLPDGARLFSVDGGHTKEIVRSDMRLAEQVCTDRGIVIADDVFNGSWPGVVEGTLAYLSDNAALRPFAIGFNKVFFARADAAKDHYERLWARALPRRRWLVREQEFVGSPVVSVAERPKNLRGLAERSATVTTVYKKIASR